VLLLVFFSADSMIAQELVEAIVLEVDTGSLKASALVSSSFCAASQRLLFRSLKLDGDIQPNSRPYHGQESITSNYSRVYTLISESPHIIAYISHLDFHLPSKSTSADEITSLQCLLPKLVQVQHCIISAAYINTRWSDYPKGLSSDVLAFISRQKLTSLTVKALGEIPPPAFLCFITSALAVAFKYTNMKWNAAEISAISPPLSPTLNKLSLGQDTYAVGELLSRPQFSKHLANLRRLSATVLRENPAAVVAATANTLQHIFLRCACTSPHSTFRT
jgi:hypothetical protein